MKKLTRAQLAAVLLAAKYYALHEPQSPYMTVLDVAVGKLENGLRFSEEREQRHKREQRSRRSLQSERR